MLKIPSSRDIHRMINKELIKISKKDECYYDYDEAIEEAVEKVASKLGFGCELDISGFEDANIAIMFSNKKGKTIYSLTFCTEEQPACCAYLLISTFNLDQTTGITEQEKLAFINLTLAIMQTISVFFEYPFVIMSLISTNNRSVYSNKTASFMKDLTKVILKDKKCKWKCLHSGESFKSGNAVSTFLYENSKKEVDKLCSLF